MRQIWPAIVLTGLALPLALAPSGCNEQDPVRLGFMAGLTGRDADLGVAGRNGALLAVEQINAAGGIKGRTVELLVRNDEQNPEKARQAARELIDLKVEAVIGPMTSSMALAAVPLFDASNTLAVSPSATTAHLSGRDDQFIRVVSASTPHAVSAARWQFERLGHRRVAVIYDLANSAYTEKWLEEFGSCFEGLGGRLVKRVAYRSSDHAAFSSQVRELCGARPDLVLVLANAVDAALICQQIRKIEGTLPIALAEWASTERLIELAGSAAEGVYVSQIVRQEDSSPRYRSFLNSYRARFGSQPGFGGITGYEATRLTLEALLHRKSGSTLKETILGSEFQGVQQVIGIDRFGDARRPNFVTVIKNGRFVHLE